MVEGIKNASEHFKVLCEAYFKYISQGDVSSANHICDAL